MATPYLTSNGLIESIKRKISFPIAQATFSEEDILKFANEELMIQQVPSVLSFHEEYYVTTEIVPLEANKSRYEIPSRAVGMRLRDIFWQDSNGNLNEMTRVSSEDRAYYQRNSGANQAIHKFYPEGNDIVLVPSPTDSPTGSLVFVYFIRPNQLVLDERAAIVSSFCSKLTVVNANIVAGDTVSISGVTFTAVAGAPSTNQFQIGGTSIITATNLATAINTNGIVSASNGSPSTAIVTADFSDISLVFSTSNSLGFVVSTKKCIDFESIPSHIVNGSIVDFLQTKGGHQIRNYDVIIPSNGISGTAIEFESEDVPDNLLIGDYICLANECIIPYLPDDLHSGLAERTCARILAALGDQEGLAATMAKIQEIEVRQGTLLDNRVEGAPQKIVARHSILRYGKMGSNRRS